MPLFHLDSDVAKLKRNGALRLVGGESKQKVVANTHEGFYLLLA